MNRQELVEKMCEADCDAPAKHYPRQTSWSGMSNAQKDDWRSGMDAALRVAIEELRTCVAKTLSQPPDTFFAPACTRYVEMVDNEIRAQLERVKTPEERVTVVRLPIGADVLVDQDWQLHFDTDKQAEIYRLGLIQQLKEQLPKNQ